MPDSNTYRGLGSADHVFASGSWIEGIGDDGISTGPIYAACVGPDHIGNATAGRIAACVNACVGLETDALTDSTNRLLLLVGDEGVKVLVERDEYETLKREREDAQAELALLKTGLRLRTDLPIYVEALPMQALHNLRLNPFAVELLTESYNGLGGLPGLRPERLRFLFNGVEIVLGPAEQPLAELPSRSIAPAATPTESELLSDAR